MAVVFPLEVVVTTVCDGVAVFPPWIIAVTASVSVSVSPSSSTDVIIVVYTVVLADAAELVPVVLAEKPQARRISLTSIWRSSEYRIV